MVWLVCGVTKSGVSQSNRSRANSRSEKQQIGVECLEIVHEDEPLEHAKLPCTVNEYGLCQAGDFVSSLLGTSNVH